MKVAVLFNTPASEVFCPRVRQTSEWIPPSTVQFVIQALRKAGHEAQGIEADINASTKLKEFFNEVRYEEFPGLVFNLSYGIQGLVRYAQLPAVLEEMGLPYVGSDPLSHCLASDKLTAKRLFRSWDLRTPTWNVYDQPDIARPKPEGETGILETNFENPVIVKPVDEAASEGLRVVREEQELHKAIRENFEKFGGPVLAEEYIGGREINVSLLGNDDSPSQLLEVLPPAEIKMEGEELSVYDVNAKKGRNGAHAEIVCPASLSEEENERASQIAVKAFQVLRCRDWARVDLRLSESGEFYILEVNTIPAIGSTSSFLASAKEAGIDGYDDLVNRLIEIAVNRYQAEADGNHLSEEQQKQAEAFSEAS